MYQETFLDCLFDFPVCNHTQGISNKNKGYYRGMIADYGIPLEAELCIYVKNGNIQKEVSIILPNLLFDDLDDISEKMLHTKEVINYRKNETCIDYFILDIGMVNKGEERQFDVTIMVAFATLITAIVVIFYLFLFGGPGKKTEDIGDYEKIFDEPEICTGYMVFPESIPEGVEDVDFYHSYRNNLFSPKVETFLQCTYDEKTYQKEMTVWRIRQRPMEIEKWFYCGIQSKNMFTRPTLRRKMRHILTNMRF